MVVVPAKITVQRTSHESDVPNRKHSKPTSKTRRDRRVKSFQNAKYGHLRDKLSCDFLSQHLNTQKTSVGETFRTNSTCHACFFMRL